jgi:hypothetical protein
MTDQTTTAAASGRGHEFTATIIINTRPFVWTEKKITFEQVLGLAFPGQDYDPAATSVEYSRGPSADHSLRQGASVNVKEGMVFDAEPAVRS